MLDYYYGPDNEVRHWRYKGDTYLERGAVCLDCDLPYAAFGGDCRLPDHTWELINPTENEGCGLLCANCILLRLRQVGWVDAVQVWLFPDVVEGATP